MPQRVFFDDSLPLFANVVANNLGPEALAAGVILRDSSGQLSFFHPAAISTDKAELLEADMRETLGRYASERPLVAVTDSFGAEAILNDESAFIWTRDELKATIVDRRLVGADWLRTPSEVVAYPPRFVFASIKGGVGRSTALCVAAAHLAARGLRVLVVDLDVEAPGLGSLLLDDATLPEFGIVDALVENGLGGLGGTFLADLVGPSALALQAGVIGVVPAFGQRSRRNPVDVLAKLARAYAEDVAPDGAIATVLDQVNDLVGRLAQPSNYDAVLVDARAGLHESSAAAILGLGAEVFLFGRDDEQTFEGYSYLLAHLGRLASRSVTKRDWIERLTPVQALAPIDAAKRTGFQERWRNMVIATSILPERRTSQEVQLPEGFQDIPWRDDEDGDDDYLLDEDSILHPLSILRSSDYEGFNPKATHDALAEAVYRNVFGELLTRIDATCGDFQGKSE